MASRAEQETVIILNQADLDAGFFQVASTNPAHLAKIKRFIPKTELAKGHPIIENGRQIGLDLALPMAFLNELNLGLAKAKKSS